MKRFIFIISILIMISACEAPLDYSRIDSKECIFVETLIGNTPAAVITAEVVIPMHSEDYDKCKRDVSVYGTIGGRPIKFIDQDNYQYSQGGMFTHEIHPGEKIEITAWAEGIDKVHAETTVPEEIRLKSCRMISRDEDFITFEIVYEEDPEDEGFYGIKFKGIRISEAPGIILSESYDMVISGSMFGDILIWDRHRARKEGNTVTFRTSVDVRSGGKDSYEVTLYRLSPETFHYLRGLYIKTTNFPSTGMGTPAFTYSNIIGGTGIAGSFWATDTIMKLEK